MYLCTSNTPRRYIYTFPEKEVSNQLDVTATSDTEKGAPRTNAAWVAEQRKFSQTKIPPFTTATELS
jgi:hypothetical protein